MKKVYQEFSFFTVQSGKAFIIIDNDRIIIKRKGLLSFNAHGLKGNKTIFINQISSIQLKEANFTIGYIQFVLNGSLENKGGLRSAMKDENTVCFDKKYNDDALKIKKYIEAYINKNNNNTTIVKQEDKYDKLAKIKKLFDDGILSQEEYEKEKKELLN